MNRDKAILLTDKIKKALQEIEELENISISYSGTFSSAQMKLNMTITEKVDSKKMDSVNFQLSRKYGFTQNIIGMEFISPLSGLFKITEFKTRNRKYPIIGIRVIDGKQYKFTPKQVLSYIGGDKIVNRNANLTKLLDD
jgi:hypothetical protein